MRGTERKREGKLIERERGRDRKIRETERKGVTKRE